MTFASTGAVTIPSAGNATPYGGAINVAGMSGNVTKVIVRLKGLTHTYPDDLDILLVSPSGAKLLLLSDAGGSANVSGITVVFDDAAAGTIANSGPLTAGTFKPINYGTGDTFASPAPASPYATALSAFSGASPNGAWKLYVVDDASSDSGSIAQGWELTITTGP